MNKVFLSEGEISIVSGGVINFMKKYKIAAILMFIHGVYYFLLSIVLFLWY